MAGRHEARAKAHGKCQLLSPAEERVLIDWCAHRSAGATPLDRKALQAYVFSISGKYPGKRWNLRFAKRHPTLKLSKPSSLDPKRAQNFNKANIDDYFAKHQNLRDTYGDIPPEHQWNMDEKGIQMGGGRKNVDGTVAELTARIRDYFNAHQAELAANPRFAGLIGRHHV